MFPLGIVEKHVTFKEKEILLWMKKKRDWGKRNVKFEHSLKCLLSFSKRILLCTLMTTDFIEFQTNECVSDDKETIKQIDTKSSTVIVVVPRRFEDLQQLIYSIVSIGTTDDGVDLRNV